MSLRDYINIAETYREEAGSSFTHNGNLYSLNKLFDLTSAIEPGDFAVSELAWILDHDQPDPNRVKTADLDAPILVTPFDGQLVVIDGLHRLAKAVTEKRETITGISVDPHILEQCRLEVESSHVWYNDTKGEYFRMERMKEGFSLTDIVETMCEDIDAAAKWVPDETPLTEKSVIGSAWVVIECDETGDFLLGKRARAANNPGQWNLFGGGIEGSENALQTALRELWEEGGLRVEEADLRRIAATPAGMTIFALTMPRRTVARAIRLNPKEVEKVKWFSIDSLPTNLHKSTRGLLQAVAAQDQSRDLAAHPMASSGAAPSMRGMMETLSPKKKRIK